MDCGCVIYTASFSEGDTQRRTGWAQNAWLDTEVKHLELNQFPDGSYPLGSGKGCCRAIKVLLRARGWPQNPFKKKSFYFFFFFCSLPFSGMGTPPVDPGRPGSTRQTPRSLFPPKICCPKSRIWKKGKSRKKNEWKNAQVDFASRINLFS